VGAVAERADPRLAATAERDRPPLGRQLVPLLVGDDEVAADEIRAVWIRSNRDWRGLVVVGVHLFGIPAAGIDKSPILLGK